MNLRNARPPLGAVLFDLDGTVLDTAPDLIAACNVALTEAGLPPCPTEQAKPYISGGARSMLGYWVVKTLEQRPVGNFPHPNEVSEQNTALFERLMERMLDYYEDNLAHKTQYFEGMESVLDELDARGLPWGIVTNKLSRFTEPLTRALHLNRRTGCIISGDTTAERKPHPLPLLEASQRLGRKAEHCVYVGDAARDIEAGRRAGMSTLAALYGYVTTGEDVAAWGADAMLSHPLALLDWLDGCTA
jgi:phosphoglycolate phosphatase